MNLDGQCSSSRPPGFLTSERVEAVVAAEDAPWRVRLVALALAGDDRVDQEAVHADDADAAAESPAAHGSSRSS